MITANDLAAYGISRIEEIIYNPSYNLLFEEETSPDLSGFEVGTLTDTGAIAVDTGVFTGRSPKDKYIVRDEVSEKTVWWKSEASPASDNKPITNEIWEHCKNLASQQLSGKKLYVVDCFAGANVNTRLSVRFILEVAWQAHFVKNMFIRPSEDELRDFKPN